MGDINSNKIDENRKQSPPTTKSTEHVSTQNNLRKICNNCMHVCHLIHHVQWKYLGHGSFHSFVNAIIFIEEQNYSPNKQQEGYSNTSTIFIEVQPSFSRKYYRPIRDTNSGD